MIDLREYEEQMTRCFYCQLCNATCPVYMEDLLETHGPRARLGLIHAAMVEAALPVTQRFHEILDRCLLCTTCTQNCPVGVPLDEIFIAARIELHEEGEPEAPRFGLMEKAMNRRALKGPMDKAKLLDRRAGLAPGEIPEPDPNPFDRRYRSVVPAQGETRAQVAYYFGCATNTLYPETGEAVVHVLTRNGIQVMIPEGLGCCGMPALADGDLGLMQKMIRTNIAVLARQEVDAIITDCTSCGMVFKSKIVQLLPEDDPLRPQAEIVARKIWEVTDYLNHLGLVSTPAPLAEDYTYHIPCHVGWAETAVEAPRSLLGDVPLAGLKEMESPEDCCGAGRSFFMEHGELSGRIRSRKLEDIAGTGVETVVTQCPACRFYLNAGLPGRRVMHPISFLAKAYGC